MKNSYQMWGIILIVINMVFYIGYIGSFVYLDIKKKSKGEKEDLEGKIDKKNRKRKG